MQGYHDTSSVLSDVFLNMKLLFLTEKKNKATFQNIILCNEFLLFYKDISQIH